MDYKSTLNLPKTDFPMKADLPRREGDFIKKWDDEKIYDKLLAKNRGKTKYILHDGPPYANGHIHFGHILNKILKDIIVKYKNMSGFFSPYIPGWDCHGLPIELGAIKELAAKESDKNKLLNPLIRRQACRDYARHYMEAQREEFRRLMVFGDWENPYLTMNNQYEADIAREFVKLFLEGYIYEGKKPVYWCASCQTALAEAEVEYENHVSSSVYVKFRLINSQKLALRHNSPPSETGKSIYFVIWTTTPWTLPSNVALALGENHDYTALECDDEIYIVAHELKNSFLKAVDFIGEANELKKWRGDELIRLHLVCDHPFMDRESKVVCGPHVTLESGTGVVHIAPGHGPEDYEIGQANGLETICPIDAHGKFSEGTLDQGRYPEIRGWEGLFVKKADKLIVDFLFAKKILLNQPGQTLTHSYPHCWRCKNPVFFRATQQWFCSLNHKELRKTALKNINCEVKWIPSWGRDRIYGMIESRPDWCLSRQRIWGVPIIVHHCSACGKPWLNKETGDFICGLFEKEGADAWWRTEKPILPEGTRCSCGSDRFEKEKSILDVWFDSGVSYAAVLERNSDLENPADLYLEGSDQHRGWFHSSLLTALATRKRAPYKGVLTHGFVVDGDGKKYSKSARNYIPPEKILNSMGAELLRLWVAAEDYRNDIRVSDEIIRVLAEIYRKIRNTCRFILGNLYDFDPSRDFIEASKRTGLDRYALHQLSRVVTRVEKAYDEFEFHVVHHTLNKFFTVDLSALYLDILKDRLYCEKAGGFLRRSAQSTFHDILRSVAPLMAPILSFTAEEVWQFIPHREGLEASVFLSAWPKQHPEWIDENLEGHWERIGMIRDEVLKVLETARKKKEIGHPLDAKVILSAKGELFGFIQSYADEWTQIFIVSQVEILPLLSSPHYESKSVATLQIGVSPADGKKCERCWNYSTTVGISREHETLCQRCVMAVS